MYEEMERFHSIYWNNLFCCVYVVRCTVYGVPTTVLLPTNDDVFFFLFVSLLISFASNEEASSMMALQTIYDIQHANLLLFYTLISNKIKLQKILFYSRVEYIFIGWAVILFADVRSVVRRIRDGAFCVISLTAFMRVISKQ